MKKIIFSLFLMSISLVPSLAMADENNLIDTDKEEQVGHFLINSGLPETSISSMAATIIQTVLGLLGVIFLVLMFYAGWLWMTAQGNDDQVKKAKDIIVAAIIGLIIIIAAYSITYFVFNSLGKASGGGSGGMIRN